MADIIQVQIRFDLDPQGGQDALYYSLADYQALTPQDIQKEKDKRIADYQNAINNPPIEVPLTKEQLQAIADQIIRDQQTLAIELIDINNKILVAVDAGDPILG